MPVDLQSISLDPPVFLAPMAGITDVPFRALVARLGAGLVVSEMVASADVLNDRPQARLRAEIGAAPERTSVQIAGCEPAPMAEAARLAAGQGARIIDINMGCPAKKVTNGWSGSALMREPERALRLIEAVVAAVDVPVTLKLRLGWDEAGMNAPEIAAAAEAAGVAMVTVHGRTRCQFYRGRADWEAIAAVKAAVTVPVVANGDICGVDEARTARALSGADAVMIGRAARGRPWLLGQVAAALRGAPVPRAHQGAALAELICGHHAAMLGFYGTALGVRVARKHLGWYLERIEGASGLRARVLVMEDARAVASELARGLADCGAALARRAA